jgi:uncharacterized protein (DUF1778 family)
LVACGTLRALSLSFELRAAPRDPYFNEKKMPGKSEAVKSVSIRLRMTAEDKAAIEAKALDRKLTVTDYLTRAGLGRAARQRADVDAINLLRACVDELKAMHANLQGLHEAERALSPGCIDRAMAAVCATIQRVWQSEDER